MRIWFIDPSHEGFRGDHIDWYWCWWQPWSRWSRANLRAFDCMCIRQGLIYQVVLTRALDDTHQEQMPKWNRGWSIIVRLGRAMGTRNSLWRIVTNLIHSAHTACPNRDGSDYVWNIVALLFRLHLRSHLQVEWMSFCIKNVMEMFFCSVSREYEILTSSWAMSIGVRSVFAFVYCRVAGPDWNETLRPCWTTRLALEAEGQKTRSSTFHAALSIRIPFTTYKQNHCKIE